MNQEESDDVILLEHVLDPDDFVDDDLELIDEDDFSPTEEVILLDVLRVDPADLEVA